MKRLLLAAALAVATTPALAETQTENIVAEQRTALSLKADPAAVQALLPAGWVPAAAPGAPNLTLVFMDRKLELTPDGKPLQAGVNRLLVVVIVARNTATGQTRNMISGGYSSDPLGSPGAYKVYAPGVVTVTRTETSEGALGASVEEHWTAKGADGATLTLDLAFTRGVPTFSASETREYSAADPDFYRIYRVRQTNDVLRNATVDRVKSVSLKASGGKLGAALGGKQQIVSITNSPFYSRLTFLP